MAGLALQLPIPVPSGLFVVRWVEVIPLPMQGVGWDAELGRGLRQLMWGGLACHGMGSTCPWGSLESGSTVSILPPQELSTTAFLHRDSHPNPPGAPLHPALARRLPRHDEINGCHFGASCAGLLLDVPSVWFLPRWFGASCAVGLVPPVLGVWCQPCHSSGPGRAVDS